MGNRLNPADVIEAKLAEKNMTPRALSEKAGLGQTYVRDLINRRPLSPSSDKLEKIADVLGCSLYDLTRNPKHKGRSLAAFSSSDDVVYIPEYNVEVAAGSGAAIPDLQDPALVWRIPRAALYGIPASSISNLAVVTVRGDSMEPDYKPHEKILVDQGDTLIRNDGVYILSNGIDLMVKMVQVLPPGNGNMEPSLRIISKNSDYPTYERAFSDVIVNGRVVGKWLWK